MKNIISVIVLILLSSDITFAQDAKVISDCTIFFDVSVDESKADPQIVKSLSGATEVLYVKGSKSRIDLITSGFKQTTITDAKSDTAVILREIGNTKYLSYLYGTKRTDLNKKYLGIQFDDTGETKTILGYVCKKVAARLSDGSAYNIFYTAALTPTNREYIYQFRDLPGMVLEYEAESTDGKTKIKYTASKLTILPVPAAMFDLPKAGYRIL